MEPLIERVPANESALLHLYLADRDVPCPQCKYNLRNLTTDICPECGEKIALRVHFVEPRQAAPIVGLIALSAGAGFNGLFLALIVYDNWRRGRGYSGPQDFMIFNACGLVIISGFAAGWIHFWKNLRKSRMRWAWAFAAMAVTAIDIIAFASTLR